MSNTGGLTGEVPFGTDVVCWGPFGRTDLMLTNYDAVVVDDGSCTYGSSTSQQRY